MEISHISSVAVFDVISKFRGSFEEFGRHLGLPEEGIQNCKNVQDVIAFFCEVRYKISEQEACFRICRALENCNESDLAQELMKR